MLPNHLLFPLIIVIIIMVIYTAYRYGCRSTETSQLQGFWETNNEFNKEAGLHIFSMFIGIPVCGVYSAYLLMIEDRSDQTILINEPIKFNISALDMYTNGDCREFNIIFTELETNLLPRKLSVRYYPNTCKIVLYNQTKVYAVFFKNPVLSELERIKSENPDMSKSVTKKDDEDEESDIESMA